MIVIYTVITGDYDTIKQPQVCVPGADFVLFTNNRELLGKGGAWQVRMLDLADDAVMENVLLSRRVKMLPHKYLPEYNVSVYIDADMVLTGDVRELVGGSGSVISTKSLAVYRNSQFTCVRDEVDALVASGRVNAEVARKQWQRYVEWGFKDDMGHTENGLIVRRHNKNEVVELMELWWQEFQNGCRRDQVSFMPCVFRCGFNSLEIIEGSIWESEYVRIEKHKINL